jgi:hypothetical protein
VINVFGWAKVLVPGMEGRKGKGILLLYPDRELRLISVRRPSSHSLLILLYIQTSTTLHRGIGTLTASFAAAAYAQLACHFGCRQVKNAFSVSGAAQRGMHRHQFLVCAEKDAIVMLGIAFIPCPYRTQSLILLTAPPMIQHPLAGAKK